MTNFKLKQVSSNRSLAKFHVLNEKDNSIIGSIAVKPEEVSDLKRCWRGAYAAPAAKAGVQPIALPRLSRKAILRGC
jgi:hypothetical protein